MNSSEHMIHKSEQVIQDDCMERQDGTYSQPCSAGPEGGDGREARKERQAPSSNHRRTKTFFIIISLCALFLGICITAVLDSTRNTMHREFIRMVTETLNAYTNGQRENTLKEIDGVTSTIQSLAVLIQENDNPDFINTYLMALNKETPDIIYQYNTKADYDRMFETGQFREKDIDTMRRLKLGETVVTDIVRSERLKGTSYIGIGVPVMKNGTFIGAVRGIIRAEELTATDLYDPAQGEISAVFLTDSESRILPVRDGAAGGAGEVLLERMEEHGIEEAIRTELRTAFMSDDLQAHSIRVGVFDGSPYYLSITGLKYNDWHLVVCLKADQAAGHFQYFVKHTRYSIIGLLLAVIVASSILVFFGKKLQKKFAMDEKRYLLLERFSDTVLFDYDCLHDTIRFTSNVSKLLRVHDLRQSGFLSHIDQIYVYAGDQETVRQLLGGKFIEDSGQLKVRLMRPDTDDYFWCLAQYQYLYEKEKLSSIIGKITDIDDLMRHEDYLLKMSETDGLTGLLNKTATENQVAERLTQAEEGILFIMDVDGFKQVNDRYGHPTGDRTLRFIGECIRRAFDGGDTLGRIGGDEMLVFVEHVSSREFAAMKAELLSGYLKSGTKENLPYCSMSIGAARFPADGGTCQELFHAADQAMYAAKKSGNMQFCMFEDMDTGRTV